MSKPYELRKMITDTQTYWEGNLDPLHRTSQRPRVAEEAWLRSIKTYVTPDITEAFQRMAPLQGKHVLELGAGLGCGAVHLSKCGAQVTAVELSKARCHQAGLLLQQHYPESAISLLQGSAESLPFESGTFDCVFGRDILMYTNPEHVVAECARVVKAGGKVVFNEALQGNPLLSLYRRQYTDAQHQRIARYLSINTLGNLPGSLIHQTTIPFHLFALSAYAMLHNLVNATAFNIFMRIAVPLDRVLFQLVPPLKHWAWRGVAIYKNP